ncbi:MAG: type II secretion system protein [Breznakia sp.]
MFNKKGFLLIESLLLFQIVIVMISLLFASVISINKLQMFIKQQNNKQNEQVIQNIYEDRGFEKEIDKDDEHDTTDSEKP